MNTITKDEKFIQRYYNNEPTGDMLKSDAKAIYRILKKYNLPKRIPTRIVDNSKILEMLQDKLKNTIKKYNVIDTKLENNIRKYKIKCKCCHQEYYTNYNKLIQKDSICITCAKKQASLRASKNKKRKDNTTGFIGVGLVSNKFFTGIRVRIVQDKITILNNLYKDEFLQEKTIIQGAVDRDLFIIEKKLPNRRNFTDNQLISNMEYLAYDQIHYIKNILETQKTI